MLKAWDDFHAAARLEVIRQPEFTFQSKGKTKDGGVFWRYAILDVASVSTGTARSADPQ